MSEWKFSIPGQPIAQPRHRHGFNKKTKRHVSYIDSDHPIHEFKATATKRANETQPIDWDKSKSCAIACCFVRQSPQSKKIPVDRKLCEVRPDCDNLIKGVKDAIKGVAYADDCLVVADLSVKVLTVRYELPTTLVYLTQNRADILGGLWLLRSWEYFFPPEF